MASLNLAPPWVIFANEVAQMFKYDSEVHVVYNETDDSLKIYVDDPEKAVALTSLLPTEKSFGNVIMTVSVIPANKNNIKANLKDYVTPAYLFETAFKGNGALAFVKVIQGIFPNDLTYVVFRNRVVQYFNDDLGDIYGQCSTLYQEIAKNIFVKQEGVFFCTDVEERVYDEVGYSMTNSPIGEWP